MSQNLLRETMVRQAVANATFKQLPITIENVRRFLPGPNADKHLKGGGGVPLCELQDFELDVIDLKPWRDDPLEIEDSRPAEHPLNLAEVRPAEHTPDSGQARPEESREVRFARASERAVKLEQERAELRIELDLANKAELEARNERDKIAHQFVRGFGKPMTQAELIRQHIESEQATRQAIAEGRLPGGRRRSTVGPSMLDKFAAAQRGGRPGFAGRGYSRGGFPASMRGQMAPRAK